MVRNMQIRVKCMSAPLTAGDLTLAHARYADERVLAFADIHTGGLQLAEVTMSAAGKASPRRHPSRPAVPGWLSHVVSGFAGLLVVWPWYARARQRLLRR